MKPIHRWLIGRCLVGGLIGVVLTAPAAFASTALIDDARASLAQGNANAALFQLKKAVRENPTSGEARFELGALEIRLGDMVAAEKDLTLARANGHPAAQVNPLLAFALLALGENEKLLANVPPCPDDAQCRSDVLAIHARARLALRDLPGADAASKAALEAVPANPSARIVHALVLMVQGDYRTAEEVIDSLLSTDPKAPEALALKGDVRRQAGDLIGAVDRFKASLAVNPRDVTVRQRLALALAALNRDDEAATEVKTVLDQAPNAPIARYLKAMLEIRAGKVADAMDSVRPVEAAIERIPRGVFLLAVIHAANGHLEQALSFATRFHSDDPDNLAGTKLLAGIHYRMRSYDKIITLLGPLQDRLGDDPRALDLLGSAYMAEGWVKEANEVLAKVAALAPNDAARQARLAVVQTQQPSTRDAGVRELENLLAADAGNAQVGMALLFSYLAQGDPDRAIDAATAMVKTQPESPLPLTIRGAVWLAKDNEAAAAADFQAALAKDPDFIPAASYAVELDLRNEAFDHARQTIDGLLSRKPADLRALMIRARIEARAGQPDRMVGFLQTAIAAHPDEADPRIQLMRTLAGLGQTAEAVQAADDLARTQPRNLAALDQAAQLYLALKEPAKGVDLYRRLQASHPESSAIHLRLGQALVGLNRLEEARTAFDRALSADRASIPAWRSRAQLEFAMKGDAAALAVVTRALAQNPDSDEARVLEGDVLTAANRLPDAEARYAAALAAHPSAVAAGRLYRVLIQQGDRPRARAALVAWLRVEPEDPGALTALAEDDLVTKNYPAAIQRYEALSARFPQNALLLNNLAYAYDAVDDPRATQTAQTAFRLQPTSPDIIDTYADLLYRKGDAAQGAVLMLRAHAMAPQNPQIAYHLARMKADAKEFDAARGLLKPILDAKLAFGEADDARALYDRLGGV